MTKNVTLIVLDPPTAAEVRACRISLGEEALVKMRAAMSCPDCDIVHPPEADAMLVLVEDGFRALKETALAWRAKELLARDEASRKKRKK